MPPLFCHTSRFINFICLAIEFGHDFHCAKRENKSVSSHLPLDCNAFKEWKRKRAPERKGKQFPVRQIRPRA